MRNVKAALEKSANLGKPISPEVIVIATNMEEPGRLADLTASNLDLKVEGAQEILEATDPIERLRRVHELMAKELEVLAMQQEISSQAKGEMDRSQREFFLRQQLKAIQSELGEGNELAEEIASLKEKAHKAKMPKPVIEEVERQLKKLERMHPDSAETATLRNWLDWMVGLPWGKQSKDNLDLAEAQRILDEDHYGLEKVKERIVEYLAVRKLKDKMKGPLLCFVGPPGVGKTSLGKSIARALGRKFVRLSLGGVKDEAEIRGHRRTYVGSMPGRIIQGIHQAGTNNPVFMMDEVDKIGADYRGDPSLGAARGAGPGAEQLLPRPLPRRALRPLQRDVHLHREPDRHHPGRLPRPHGADPPLRLHRGGEGRDRQAPHRPQAARGARHHPREPAPHRQVAARDHQQLHPRGGAAERGARDRVHLAQGGAQGGGGPGHDHARSRPATCRSTWARRRSSPRRSSRRTRSASPPAWPGRPPAATSCSSRPARCPARDGSP